MEKIIERSSGRVVCEDPTVHKGAQLYRAGVPTRRELDAVSFSIPVPSGPYVPAAYDLLLEDGSRQRLLHLLGLRFSSSAPGVLGFEADLEDPASP